MENGRDRGGGRGCHSERLSDKNSTPSCPQGMNWSVLEETVLFQVGNEFETSLPDWKCKTEVMHGTGTGVMSYPSIVLLIWRSLTLRKRWN